MFQIIVFLLILLFVFSVFPPLGVFLFICLVLFFVVVKLGSRS